MVGEGVDTPEKLAMLTAAGCDHFQGYLISKPLPLDDLGIWALTRSRAATARQQDDRTNGRQRRLHAGATSLPRRSGRRCTPRRNRAAVAPFPLT